MITRTNQSENCFKCKKEDVQGSNKFTSATKYDINTNCSNKYAQSKAVDTELQTAQASETTSSLV